LGLQIFAIGNMVFTIFSQGSLQNLWSSISSLQLTVHLPLNQITYPPHLQEMFKGLIKVVQFDLLD